MTRYLPDQWFNTFAYLYKFGINPHHICADGYNNLGYESFIYTETDVEAHVEPGYEYLGRRLIGPGDTAVREYNEWPEGFSWIDFVTCIQDDIRDWELQQEKRGEASAAD